MRRVFAALILAPLVLRAQLVVVVRLQPPDAKLDEEFTILGSVRELSDGRVILTDPREMRMVVADLRTGKVEPIGRTGDGPGEYRMPAPVRALSGDSSFMADLLGLRWLLLDGARIVATIPPDAPAILVTGGLALGADVNGFVLSTKGPPPRTGAWEYGKGDSTASVRVARATGRADTVAWLRRAPGRGSMTVAADGRVVSSSASRQTLTVGEEALLFTDGWLAVTRLEPYRVDWRAPDGRWIHGAPLPVPLIKLDDREKRASVERTARGSSQPARSPDTIKDWPATLPPYTAASPLTASLDGRLLVMRQRSADHPETRYDVVNRRGILEVVITMPENERILGFGARSVYVVVTDEDGIQRVRRHPWPTGRPLTP